MGGRGWVVKVDLGWQADGVLGETPDLEASSLATAEG